MGNSALAIVGILWALGPGDADSLKARAWDEDSIPVLQTSSGFRPGDSARALSAGAAGHPTVPQAIDPQMIWNAGQGLQNTIWLDLASMGCLFFALYSTPDYAPGIVIGLTGSFSLSLLSIVNFYHVGASLKKASGIRVPDGGRAKTDRKDFDHAECDELPDPVDRFNCSRQRR